MFAAGKMHNYPTSDQIDPDEAKYLYENHCAILVLENLPTGSEFGIDMIAYRTGEKFRGVKLIPPGVHFVYACSMDKNNKQTLGPRCGFFHNFQEKEFLLKRWSIADEDFDDTFQPDDEYLLRYKDNLRDLDPYLGPYNYSTHAEFRNLTHMLTPEIVTALMPDCQRLRSVPYLTEQNENKASHQRIPRASLISQKPNEETIVPHLKPDARTVIHFTEIPTNHLTTDQSISPAEITQYNLDTTMKLEHCFKGPEALDRLLAEFQFAFVTFLLCHIYECFERWKCILSLICLVDSGLSKLPSEFLLEFINIVTHQVKHIQEDLFEDIVDSNNLIRHYIEIFSQNVENHSGIDENVKTSTSNFRQLLMDKFGWHFNLDEEDEEDQPVIVEL